MVKVLLNIIGTPRNYMTENVKSILQNIVSCNKECSFDVVIHTSEHWIETCTRVEMGKKRNLHYKDTDDLKTQLYENYKILSKDLRIIIEPIDFDIGLKEYNYKSFNNYLRIKRIFDTIQDINKYEIIINCRNDIIFSSQIDIKRIGNHFYTLLGKTGGFRGYAHGDYDCCFLFNNENYCEYNKCINHIFTYNEEKKVFYKTDNLKFIIPLFEKNSFPFQSDVYYEQLGKKFNSELSNRNTKKTSCGLGEVFINFLTHFLKEINSKWDVHHFNDVNVKILLPI